MACAMRSIRTAGLLEDNRRTNGWNINPCWKSLIYAPAFISPKGRCTQLMGSLSERGKAKHWPWWVKAAVEKVQTEAKFRLELVQKEFEGERNVLQARITSLEALVKDQSVQLAKMNEQVEKSYTQVQAIAVKAVEGSAAKITSVVQPQQRQGE